MIKCCLQLSALNCILYIFCHCSLKDLKTINQANKLYLPKSTWGVQQTEKDTRQDWNLNESASHHKFGMSCMWVPMLLNISETQLYTCYSLDLCSSASTMTKGHCRHVSCCYWSSGTIVSWQALVLSCTLHKQPLGLKRDITTSSTHIRCVCSWHFSREML